MLKKVLKEPLIHFLLLGGGFFLLYNWVAAPEDTAALQEIILTQSRKENLVHQFESKWKRAPSQVEEQALFQTYFREEVLYREALASGLDQNDVIVRDRLIEKMKFMAEDLAAVPSPTDSGLQAFYQANKEQFQRSASTSFRQVFFNTDSEQSPTEIEGLLTQLNSEGATANLTGIGQNEMLGDQFGELPPQDIAALFGEGFAAKIQQAPPESWIGPIESKLGLHLICITKRSPQETTGFESARPAVTYAWRQAQKQIALETHFNNLEAGYQLKEEQPE